MNRRLNVLVDTSVWVGHFKNQNDKLVALLLGDDVLVHPMIVGELACGTPPAPREQTLGDIKILRAAKQASLGEVMDFIEREQLYGQGCGFIDISLLASTMISPDTSLWTYDKGLKKLAERFDVAFSQ